MNIFYIFVAIALILLIIDKISQSTSNNMTAGKPKEYIEKELMTPTEKEFFAKLIKVENEIPVKIIPQVNLAAIIKIKNKTRYQNELYRNIDYAIFSQDYNKLLLLIELNDSSHNSKKRKERDRKVKNICKSANIKLITFYTGYPNEENYIINRILKELNEKFNSYGENM